MNKLILTISFVILASLSFGQKCKVQVDPFTNSKVVSCEFGKYIIFSLKNNEILLRYQLQFDGEMNSEIPKGSLISFKLENGDIMELSTLDDASAVTIAGSTQSFTSAFVTEYFVTMKLTKEQLKSFASSKMTHVRYPDLKGGFTTNDKSKRWIRKLIEGARCIETNLEK